MVARVKKMYKTPSIKVHGSIAEITRSRTGKVSKGISDFYSSGDPNGYSAPIAAGEEG